MAALFNNEDVIFEFELQSRSIPGAKVRKTNCLLSMGRCLKWTAFISIRHLVALFRGIEYNEDSFGVKRLDDSSSIRNEPMPFN